MVADELALGFRLDFGAVLFEDHVAGRLARAEARQNGLFLVIFRDGVKGRINGGDVQFHPHELFARGQSFNGYVHGKK